MMYSSKHFFLLILLTFTTTSLLGEVNVFRAKENRETTKSGLQKAILLRETFCTKATILVRPGAKKQIARRLCVETIEAWETVSRKVLTAEWKYD
ncbi:hypothetical protein HOM50_03665 [bacterium]|jgi:hypothetical protein|nr:hypothetical protein [bacterium]MBT5015475.1 hypothetical protein [bacterium]